MNIRDALVLVTGAGKGIGRAIAASLASEGAHLLLNARTANDLTKLKREIEATGGRAESFPGDIMKDEIREAIFADIEKRFGRLDVLVNNAGMGRFSPVRSMPVTDLDAMWNLNMRALFQCTKAALIPMERQKSGTIVNIASLAGKNAFVGGAGYAATKWALLGFSRSLMLEEREFNIRVITICPGSVDTDFSPHDTSKREKILAPSDVARTVVLALSMPDRAMVSEIDIRPTVPR